MLTPTQAPIGLQLAPDSGYATLASLTAEDGITLGLGLAPAAGSGGAPMAPLAIRAAAAPAGATPVAGQVSLNSVTYPALTFPVVATATPTATVTATPTPTGTPVNSAGGVSVYVGYADSLRPNPNLPVPWQGAPNTAFVGGADSSGAYDSGAIRLDNTTTSTVTIKDVSVVLHTVNNDGSGGPAPGQTFDLWGAHDIPANGSLILAATGPGDNFDTSDFPLSGTSCTNPAGPSNNPPHLTLTFGDNSQVTMTDTAHVLDTGGYDTVNCPGGNESLQWRALGTTGVAQASGALTLTVPTATQIAGLPYSEVATLTDASGQPQPNAAVNFSITSGPNAGLTGTAYTDSQGQATFTYTGTVAGTDTITASITNASGGVVSAAPVAVTWAPPPVADLSLRAIATGLDVRLVLHNANSSGPFTLALAPDPNTQLWQDASGAIRATQAITQYGDDGSPVVVTQTEYLAQNPIATDSNADPASVVTTGPATSTLVLGTDGRPYVTLAVDPAWLNDPHRTFPVAVDLPIATGASVVNTGLAGSVNSCAPDTQAPPTGLVVGSENGCTYNGQTYFDLTSLPTDAPIVSATLRLYTPGQTSATGVQVYQNAPPDPDSDPAQAPSWNGAPVVMTGTASIAQSGSDGHWQSWNVTSLVQQWVQDGSTNGGLTLEGSGGPLRFAGGQAVGSDDPSLTPYLDIVYGNSPSSPTMTFSDGAPAASTIFGEAGSYTVQGENGPKTYVPNCAGAYKTITCPIGGQIKPSAVRNNLGGHFIRFGVQLACPSFSQYGINTNAPGDNWWSTSPQNPLKDTNGNPVMDGKNLVSASPNNYGSVEDIVLAAKYYHVIPIIDLLPYPYDGLCQQHTTPSVWYNQMQDFVKYLYNNRYSTGIMAYFEIGNEPDTVGIAGTLGNTANYTDGQRFDGKDGQDGSYHYADIFAAAARGVQQAIPSGALYRILTAGMAAPTADHSRAVCLGAKNQGQTQGPIPYGRVNNYSNVNVAGAAIRAAEQPTNSAPIAGVPQGPAVLPSHLGVAVHPYSYNTNNHHFWRNYYQTFDHANPHDPLYPKRRFNHWAGPCEDLDPMLKTWRNGRLIPGNLPVIFTEDNWTSDPGLSPYENYPAEAAYLADLLTWLYAKNALYHGTTPSASPIRILMFRGVDAAGIALGLYDNSGADSKLYQLSVCHNPAIGTGQHGIAYDYATLVGTKKGCYQ